MHVIRDSPLFLLQMDSPEGKHLRKRKYPLAGRNHPFVQRSKRHLRLSPYDAECEQPAQKELQPQTDLPPDEKRAHAGRDTPKKEPLCHIRTACYRGKRIEQRIYGK